MKSRFPFVCAGAALAALLIPTAPPAPAASKNPLAAYAQRVEVDKFNPSVPPDRKGKLTPRRGGSVRIRTSADPSNLNDLTHRDATAAVILGYMSDGLITRDPETFEYLPWLAESWEVRDLVILKDGSRLEGRVLAEDDASVTLAEDVGIVTLLENRLATLDIEAGLAVTKDGRRLEGDITPYEYTVEIEVKPAAKPRRIPLEEVDDYLFKLGEEERSRKAIKRRCVFYMPVRENVRWHDGSALSIDDFLFGWEAVMNPNVDAARIRSYYLDIERVEKVGDRTLKFTYRKPYFQALSVCGGLTPLSRALFKPDNFVGDPKGFAEHFNKHPYGLPGGQYIGTGPYRHVSWTRGVSIILERNEDYWASKADLPYWKPDQPYLDRIEYVTINNVTAALKALTNGEVDADFDIEPGTWIRQETKSASFTDRIVRAKGIVPLYTYIGYNLRKPQFEDPRVREALTYLIPRQRILEDVHHGLGRVVTGPFFIDGPAYDKSLPLREHDPRKARSLLRRARWLDRDGDGVLDKDGVKFEFEYMIHTAREYHARIADIIKESVEEAGIKVTIRRLDWTVFMEAINDRKFDVMRGAWSAVFDPDPFQIWHSSQADNRGSNHVGYKNPEVDRLIERMREEFDAEKRWAMAREVHRLVYEDQPYTFGFCFDSLFFYNRRFRGVKIYKVGSTGVNLSEWFVGE